MTPDLYAGRRLIEAGAAAVMPLGAPIGSNRGLQMKEMIRIMIEELDITTNLVVIVAFVKLFRTNQNRHLLRSDVLICMGHSVTIWTL